MSYFILALIGLLGGMASGMFGVGGGLLFVPLLIFFRGFEPHQAVATSLAVIVPTAVAAVLRHGAATAIDWRTALFIALFALLGAWLGAGISLQLNALLLRRLFALFLLLMAFKMFFPN